MEKNHLSFPAEKNLNDGVSMSDVKWIYKLSKNRSRQGLYEFLEPQFSKIKAGENVLTIGSGGNINELLEEYGKKNGFQITSFDIDEERNPDIVGDLHTYDFGENMFDTVVLSEVLEHLHSPHLGIQNIYKFLKPGGRLILTTPFIFPIHDRPYDYYRFTKYGLQHLLSDFQDVEVKERNSALESIDVLWMRFHKLTAKHTFLLKHIIIFVVYYLKRPLTKFLMRYIDTDIMTTGYNVSAKKPA